MSYSAPSYNEAATSLQEGATSRRYFRAGAKMTDQWGTRTYRYCRVADRTAFGRMVGSPITGAASSGYGLASSVYVKSLAAGYGANAGDTEIKVFSAKSLASTTFQDGFITVSEGIGQGQGTLAIKRYEAGAAGKTTRIYLWDPLRHSLSTTSRIVIHANPYVNLLETSGRMHSTLIPRGVLVVGLQSGAKQTCGTSGWTWIQTKGPGTAVCRGAWKKQENLYPSKSGGLSGSDTNQLSGYHVAIGLRAGAAGKYAAIELDLE